MLTVKYELNMEKISMIPALPCCEAAGCVNSLQLPEATDVPRHSEVLPCLTASQYETIQKAIFSLFSRGPRNDIV